MKISMEEMGMIIVVAIIAIGLIALSTIFKEQMQTAITKVTTSLFNKMQSEMDKITSA